MILDIVIQLEGGINMFDMRTYYDSIQEKWVSRTPSDDSLYTQELYLHFNRITTYLVDIIWIDRNAKAWALVKRAVSMDEASKYMLETTGSDMFMVHSTPYSGV